MWLSGKEHVSWKHENMRLNPQHVCKRLGMAVRACNLGTVGGGLGEVGSGWRY